MQTFTYSTSENEMEQVIPTVVESPDCFRWTDQGFLEGVMARSDLAWKQALQPALYFVWAVLCWVAWLLKHVAKFVFTYRKTTLLLVLVLWFKQVFIVFYWFLAWYFDGWMSFAFFSPSAPIVPVLSPVAQFLVDWQWWVIGCAVGQLVLNLILVIVIIFLILKPNKVRRVCEHGFVVERSVEGSTPVNTSCPDFVCEVWCQFAGRRTRMGTAFRIGHRVYTAMHVIQGAEKCFLRAGDREVEVAVSAFKQYDVDIAYCDYDHILMMASGKFVKRFTSVYCMVNNGSTQTMGYITLHPVVGHVEYSGTTLPSYSGAPYFVGRTVYGMHVGAGQVNVGVDAAFLHALETTVCVKEASEFSTDPSELQEEFRRSGGKMEARLMPNEMYSVRVQGQYRVYDEETYNRVAEKFANLQDFPAYRGEASWEEIGLKPLTCDKQAGELVVKPTTAAAAFTYQDSENCVWPAAGVTPVAGPVSTEPLVSVAPPKPQLDIPIVSKPPAGTTQAVSIGRKLMDAQLSVVSRSTSNDIVGMLELLRKVRPTVMELRALNMLAANLDSLQEKSTTSS